MLHHQTDVTAAIAQKHQNGGEDQMEHGLCVMPAGYVRTENLLYLISKANNISRLRQAHKKNGCDPSSSC
jgi:hypothetical protein